MNPLEETTVLKSLAVVAVLTTVTTLAAPAFAQNNNPAVAGSYYEDRASAQVTSSNVMLTMAPTPAGKYVTITEVSCVLNVDSSQTLAVALLQVQTVPGGGVSRYINILGNVYRSTVDGYGYIGILASPLSFKMGAGRYPSISISMKPNSSASMYADCTIAGTLSDT